MGTPLLVAELADPASIDIPAIIAPLMTPPRLTSFAPQFLVDDLARSMAYYRKLGFAFGEPWGGF